MSLCLYGYPLKDSENRYTFYFVGFEHLLACSKDTPPVMHLFNVNSGNTGTICEIYNLKVTKWTDLTRWSGVSVVDFQQINTSYDMA